MLHIRFDHRTCRPRTPKLVDDLLDNSNGGIMNDVFVFSILKKCFDTANYDLLLLKLQMYGVENNELC